MNNPENYEWQTPYVLAILEPDNAKLVRRIAEARQAIERRLAKPIQIDGPEHLAIKDAWKALAALKAERLDEII
jgi:hypothetical protein